MAKTNPYSSRQATALAFDEEQAVDDVRRAPDAMPRRGRSRAASQASAAAAATTRPLRFESSDTGDPGYDDEDADDGIRGARAVPRRTRRLPLQPTGRAGSRFARFLLRTRIGLVLLALGLVAAIALLVLGYRAFRGFVESDPHFRIASSSSIQIVGAAEVSRAELLSVFGADLGRNIFFVPLAARRSALEQLPWVRQASVMRLLPDQLRVSIVERAPAAFVRLGSTVELIDGEGVILHLAPATLAARHYSFPVVTGLRAEDTPASRAARMRLYGQFVAELDGGGRAISSELSEVDLADPEDVRVTVPAQGSDLELHLGNSDFLPRYRSYQAHLPQWRQQYPHLRAIDLRYDRQVVLKMADGAESEASSVDTGASLTAAPPVAGPAAQAERNAVHHAAGTGTGTGVHHVAGATGHAAAHAAGHGAVHTKGWAWRPR